MKIGLDFDNTIVCYDGVFHKVAVEQGVIPADTSVDKVSVRNALRAKGQEGVWTEMQGYVYGARMDDATFFPSVIDTLVAARDEGHSLFIVSHKTRHPFMGPKYDLHEAARNWIFSHLVFDGQPLVEGGSINFREKKSDKLDRSGHIGCDIFLDDLPEILEAPNFPVKTKSVLFDPRGHHLSFVDGPRVSSWIEFRKILSLV
mgnify:CR=1 FL=1